MDYKDIQHHATQLIGLYGARDTMLEEMRRMFHMEWSEQPTGDWIKETMSQSAFNATIGAVRLLVSTEPQFVVPFDEADATAKQTSEKVEQAARAMWAGSGRVSLRPIHYDVVLSGLLFAEVVASVTKVSDLVSYAEKSENKGHKARLEMIAGETPYLFKCYNPATCYPDFDSMGLRGLLRRTKTTWGEVIDTWGLLAETAVGAHWQMERLKEVTVNDWYDWERRAIADFAVSSVPNSLLQQRPTWWRLQSLSA